jgi:lysophospholipase L1-like esterase
MQLMITGRYTAQTIEVFNAGVGGRFVSQDRSRLADAIRDTHPEVVLLMHGANDLNRDKKPGIGAMIGALEDLVGEAIGRGTRVFLATLPPQRPDSQRGGAASFLADVNTQISRTALDEGATLVDVNAGMTLSDIGQDGLHPTESGYERMAAIWLESLKAAYERPPEEGSPTSAASASDVHPVRGHALARPPAAAPHD